MKLHLKVELIGEKSLKMTIIQICDEALRIDRTGSIRNDSKIFQDNENKTTIWSFDDFIFDSRQIRFPEKSKLMKRISHTHHFSSDEERHIVLRNYYKTFNNWALNTKLFPNTNINVKKRVLINGNFWQVI